MNYQLIKLNVFFVALILCLYSNEAVVKASPLSKFTRLTNEPILSPGPNHFDESGAFNPASIKHNHKIVLLYRAQDKKGVSTIGYADSKDGIHFIKATAPVFTPKTSYETGGGIEDPRLVKIGDQFYLTYTGYNKQDAQLCLARSTDLKHWQRLGIILPAYKGTWNKQWTKSGAILTKKIKGKYWMYYLGTRNGCDEMGLANSTDLIHWQDATPEPILPKRDKQFDARVVEPGPPPIITKQGILLIYNGADKNLIYRTGYAIFDVNDPRKLLLRSKQPIFVPLASWEKKGQVPSVVFIEGLVKTKNNLLLYYGGADKYIGVVNTKLKP